jgi:hypothetical protein
MGNFQRGNDVSTEIRFSVPARGRSVIARVPTQLAKETRMTEIEAVNRALQYETHAQRLLT